MSMLSLRRHKIHHRGRQAAGPGYQVPRPRVSGTAEETAAYAQSLGSVYEAIKVNAVDRAAADIEAVAKASNSL